MDRPRRTNAGTRTLPDDFCWPEDFGRKEKIPDEPCPEGNKSEIRRSEKSVKKSDCTSKRSQVSSNTLEMLRIDYEKQKKIVELEREKRLLEIEAEFKKAELEASSRLSSKMSSKSKCKTNFESFSDSSSKLGVDVIDKWVASTVQENPGVPRGADNIFENFPVKSNVNLTSGAQVEKRCNVNEVTPTEYVKLSCPDEQGKQQSDSGINNLCKTLENVLNATRPATYPEHALNSARQAVSRDFPIFHGYPEEWPLFNKHFQMIRNLCHYSEEEILLKFQNCLKGDAKETVSGMLLAGCKIEVIMNTLRMRFGRPEYIVESLLQKIKNISVIKESNFEQIIKFSNQVTNAVSTMLTLEYTGHLSNPELLRELYRKLPEFLRLKWGEFVSASNGEANLLDFSKFLEQTAEAACYVSSVPVCSQSSFKKREQVFGISENAIKKCFYCEKDISHTTKICPDIEKDDLNTRWKKVTEKKLCFVCLKKNHRKSQCQQKKPCGVNGCRSLHHSLLHNSQIHMPKDRSESQVRDTPSSSREQNCTIQGKYKKALLRMIPIFLQTPTGQETKVLAMCDEGSTVSLIDKTILDDLQLVGIEEPLCLQWTNDITANEENSQKLDLRVRGTWNGSRQHIIRNVRTVSNLSLPRQSVRIEDWKSYSHLTDLPIENYNDRPRLLIGQDNIDLIVPIQSRNIAPDIPMASKCRLGWSLHGSTINPAQESFHHARVMHVFEVRSDEDELVRLMKDSYSTEAFGIMKVDAKIPKEETRALEIMRDTIKWSDDRYEIGLLWKNNEIELPNNKNMALLRLKSVENKCKKNENIKKQYQEKIDAYVQKNYARKLTAEEFKFENPGTWFLPHFAVENENKPGKIRMVFDAAAKFNGVSLNDQLLSGPDLLKSLVTILLNFRRYKIAFLGDIREMFHQIRIRKEDRPYQRFLWRDLQDREPDIYEMQVMTFGATCSPVCAQYVKNKTALDFAKDESIKNAIINKFYVDDYLDSVNCEKEALDKILEVCNVLKKGGFEIVNWVTNSKTVTKELCPDILATSKNMDKSEQHRALGMWWDSTSDTFFFKIHKIDIENKKITKRFLLKLVMSLFDPLGLVSCFAVRGRILMQDVWRSGSNWDEELAENLKTKVIKWYEDLKKLDTVSFPRCLSLKIPQADEIELHVFCDSSEKAFAAVAYLRIVVDTDIDVALVTGKCRVAPIKTLSIPRLELQGALMACRLANSLKQELEIEIHRTVYWTDSKCVLAWIRSDGSKLFKPFVSHRIGEIQETSDPCAWRWLPGELNVADEATRFEKKGEEVVSNRWIFGPSFLKNPEINWPKENLENLEVDENRLEIRQSFLKEHVMLQIDIERDLPDINRFSNWNRLIRSTAWCLRFKSWLIAKKHKNSFRRPPCLTVDEIEAAEKVWIKVCQEDSFQKEIHAIKNNKPLERDSRLRTLNPDLLNNMIILSGRTNLSTTLTKEAKNPFILCPSHKYTKLLIQHYHERFWHKGVETVLNALRQKFWILNGRTAVKSAFRNCQKCKNERVKPQPPLMGQLPISRVSSEQHAFTNVGMDFFGPIAVSIGRRTEKRWGVIFTCMAVRAIHLEVASSLNTDSAIMALRRFIARRSYPKNIYCDNGTNFKAADRELKEELKRLEKKKVIDFLTTRGIQFHFNPPGAPHMGGVWERLIQSVKKVLGKILHCQTLKEETLYTVFVEAENIVNARPLTKISTDPNDLEPVTPNHFLMGWSNIDSLVPGDLEGKSIRREWRKSQMLINSFWNRWTKEYLPTLNQRNIWNKNLQPRPLKEDDVVVLLEDNAPRYAWKLGKIINTYPGPDGKIRVVDVKVGNSIFKRPVTKICQLEVNEGDKE